MTPSVYFCRPYVKLCVSKRIFMLLLFKDNSTVNNFYDHFVNVISVPLVSIILFYPITDSRIASFSQFRNLNPNPISALLSRYRVLSKRQHFKCERTPPYISLLLSISFNEKNITDSRRSLEMTQRFC